MGGAVARRAGKIAQPCVVGVTVGRVSDGIGLVDLFEDDAQVGAYAGTDGVVSPRASELAQVGEGVDAVASYSSLLTQIEGRVDGLWQLAAGARGHPCVPVG